MTISKSVRVDNTEVAALACLPENSRIAKIALGAEGEICVEREFLDTVLTVSGEEGTVSVAVQSTEAEALSKALSRSVEESRTMWRALRDYSKSKMATLDCDITGVRAGSVYFFSGNTVTVGLNLNASSIDRLSRITVTLADGFKREFVVAGMVADCVQTAAAYLKKALLEREQERMHAATE